MPLVAFATARMVSAGTEAEDGLADLRAATETFRDVEVAIDAGYVQFFGCVHEPLAGAMGIHFVNGALVEDPAIDELAPEALTYAVDGEGRYQLAAVEYVVFKDAWDATHDQPPSLFGETFNVVEEPNRYGIPTFYELHVWAWRENPTGTYEDWNPHVLCAGTEGHVP
jgi:hypothetical protein